MQILSTCARAAIAAIAIVQAPAASGPVLVVEVVDGGTIDVQSVGRVHLLGIAAPRVERRAGASAPLGLEARDRLAGLVGNRWVKLQFDRGRQAGTTGRSAYVLLEDGTFVNAVLVREGLARVAGRVSLSRFPELQRAEEDAQRQERGMWNPLGPTGPTASQVYKTKKPAAPKAKKKKGTKKTVPRVTTVRRARPLPHPPHARAIAGRRRTTTTRPRG